LEEKRRFLITIILISFTFFYIVLLTGLKVIFPAFITDKEILFFVLGHLFTVSAMAINHYFKK